MDILLRPPPFSTRAVWLLVLAIDASAALQATTPPPVPGYDRDIDNGTLGYYPSWNFMTEGEISAPRTNWLQWNQQCDDGMYYFLTPRGYSLPDPGPMILDSRGELVWSKHFANQWGGQAYDLMVQHYQGQEYLTFWTGDDQIRGHGSGSYTMVSDDSLPATCSVWSAARVNGKDILTLSPARLFLRNSSRRQCWKRLGRRFTRVSSDTRRHGACHDL